MLTTFGRLLAAGALAIGLAACSPSGPVPGDEAKTGEWVKSELLKAESQGAMGEVFSALRESEPEIYAKLIDAATRGAAAGKSPFEAGAEVRPLYLARFMELGKTAADADVNELLTFSADQMQALMAIDPQLCVTVAMGGVDERITQLPKDMLEREMRIMARMIRAGEQNAPAASLDEVNAWIQNFAATNPDALNGLALMGQTGLTSEQATAICQSNIALSRALSSEDPATSAKLFRALLQQA
jgi:hypothetical protein